MQTYNPERLRYLPQQEPFNKHLDAPGAAYAEHMKDVEAKRQAEQVMAMRQAAQEEDMRRGQVADEQRAIGMNRDEAHAQSRDELYGRQEERRQGEALFNRQKLTKAEHEQLIHDLYFPPGTPGTPEYVARQEYAAAALQRAGYQPPEPILEDAPAAPGATAAPAMPAAPAAPPKPMTPKDKVLSGQLDNIDATYSKGLGVKPGFIAGRPSAPTAQRPEVAKSNAMLDPDDPYNKLVR